MPIGPPVLCCGKFQILRQTKPFSAVRDVFYADIKQSNFIYNNKTHLLFFVHKITIPNKITQNQTKKCVVALF